MIGLAPGVTTTLAGSTSMPRKRFDSCGDRLAQLGLPERRAVVRPALVEGVLGRVADVLTGVSKSGSPISRWTMCRPCASSARARAAASKAVSVPMPTMRCASFMPGIVPAPEPPLALRHVASAAWLTLRQCRSIDAVERRFVGVQFVICSGGGGPAMSTTGVPNAVSRTTRLPSGLFSEASAIRNAPTPEHAAGVKLTGLGDDNGDGAFAFHRLSRIIGAAWLVTVERRSRERDGQG